MWTRIAGEIQSLVWRRCLCLASAGTGRAKSANRLRPCFATREYWYLSVFKYQYLNIRKISVSVIFIYQQQLLAFKYQYSLPY